MQDLEFLRWLFGVAGPVGAVAGMMFYFYRKDVRAYTDLWKGQSEILVGIVKENTAAITANTKTIEALMLHLGSVLPSRVTETRQ